MSRDSLFIRGFVKRKKKMIDIYQELVYTNKSKRQAQTEMQCHTVSKGEDDSMPLSMFQTGDPGIIKKIGGREDTRRFLENLGFVIGAIITVISDTNGNMIVNVKDSRVAIGKEMANKIFVSGSSV